MLPPQNLTDAICENLAAHRLREKMLSTALVEARTRLLTRDHRGDKNDGNTSGRGVFANARRNISAVRFGHNNIKQDDIWLKATSYSAGLWAFVNDLNTVVPSVFQIHFEHAGEWRFVVNDENTTRSIFLIFFHDFWVIGKIKLAQAPR